jgi:DNA-binding NarL/FixJ family response regulator
LRILIIEDDEPYSLMLAQFLAPHIVDRVLELEQGLMKLGDDYVYDVVILDLGFPGIAPKQTLSRVFNRSPQSAVVVVTGNTDQKTMEKAFDLGAHGYIVKNEVTTTVINVVVLSAYNVHKRLRQYQDRLEVLATETTQLWQRASVQMYRTADDVSKALVELHDKIKAR